MERKRETKKKRKTEANENQKKLQNSTRIFIKINFYKLFQL